MNTFNRTLDFITGLIAVAAFVALVMGSPYFTALACIPIGWMTGVFVAKIVILMSTGKWND